MRIARTRSLAAAATMVATGAMALVWLRGTDAGPLHAAPGLRPPAQVAVVTGTCAVTASKSAAPPVVRLGGEVTVTLETFIACPDLPPLHLVLVLDGSGSMQGTASREMKRAATHLIRVLDPPSHPGRKIGVVEVSTVARTLCPLTDQTDWAIGCVNRVGAAGGSRLDLGMQEALRVLAGGRSRDQARDVMLLLSDGGNNAGCDPVLQAAAQVRGQGVLLIAVCLGRDCDAPCMRAVACGHDPALCEALFYEVRDPTDLIAVFDTIGAALDGAGGELLEVVEEPGPAFSTVPNSMVPKPAERRGDTVVWRLGLPPTGGVTMTLHLRADRVGFWPADRQASGRLKGFFGQVQTWSYPVPWVYVIDASVPPTVTVTAPPAPTATTTPSPAPTATPGPARPTATPTSMSGTAVPLAVCDEIRSKVPPAALAAALANPPIVAGHGRLCRPELPPGPGNTVRTSLSIASPSKPYHPLYNALQWKCGCP